MNTAFRAASKLTRVGRDTLIGKNTMNPARASARNMTMTSARNMTMTSFHDFKAKTGEGQELTMSQFKGKAVLIQNVSAN